MSATSALLSQSCPPPMSAMCLCRGELKGSFMELRCQSGEHDLVCSTTGIRQAIQENQRRHWAPCGSSRMAAVGCRVSQSVETTEHPQILRSNSSDWTSITQTAVGGTPHSAGRSGANRIAVVCTQKVRNLVGTMLAHVSTPRARRKQSTVCIPIRPRKTMY